MTEDQRIAQLQEDIQIARLQQQIADTRAQPSQAVNTPSQEEAVDFGFGTEPQAPVEQMGALETVGKSAQSLLSGINKSTTDFFNIPVEASKIASSYMPDIDLGEWNKPVNLYDIPMVKEATERVMPAGQSGAVDASRAIGEFGGEIAQFMLPAKAATGAITEATTRFPQLLKRLGDAATTTKKEKLGGALANAVGASTIGALQAPEEGEDRETSAAQEGASSLAGDAIGGVLKKALRGFDVTDAAKKLMSKGVELTPAQATKSNLPRAAETVLSYLPWTSTGAKRARDKATGTYNEAIFKEAAPEGYKDSVSGVGAEGFTALKNAYDDAYSRAWGRAGRPDDAGLENVIQAAEKGQRELSKESGSGLGKLIDEVIGLSNDYSPTKLKDVDNLFRKKINAARSGATPNIELADVLSDMRTQFRGSVKPEAKAALDKVDSQYGKYLATKKAVASQPAMLDQGLVSPANLMGGVARVASDTARASQTGPMQEIASLGQQTLGQKTPSPILDVRKALAMSSPINLSLEGIGNVALGRTKTQKKGTAVAEALRSLGINGGTVAAALGE